ncbi:unnamed protein product [Urochloa decumbens]|uniref:Uncharacterized protein n=1 Tax=Urochloa decumbens TaxID=240449 RepID=A0ABC8W0W7_9POAL
MSSFAGQRSRPWVGMAGAGGGNPSEPAVDSSSSVAARDDAAAASSMRGGAALGSADASTNASAISFGFAATAVLVSMFLLMAIFEHLIKPGLASSSSTSSSSSSARSDDDVGEGRGRRRRRIGQQHPGRLHHHHHGDASSPDKLGHSPKVGDEDPVAGAPDLTVLMPGHRYPTFLAQPAPLAPCPREGVRWPPHEQRCSFLPP